MSLWKRVKNLWKLSGIDMKELFSSNHPVDSIMNPFFSYPSPNKEAQIIKRKSKDPIEEIVNYE